MHNYVNINHSSQLGNNFNLSNDCSLCCNIYYTQNFQRTDYSGSSYTAIVFDELL